MSTRFSLGMILLSLGVVWLLSNLSFIQIPSLWGWIPIGIIGTGIWLLFHGSLQSLASSIGIILIGVSIGLSQLSYITPGQIYKAFFPTMIILLGIHILSNSSQSQEIHITHKKPTPPNSNHPEELPAKIMRIISILMSKRVHISPNEHTYINIISLLGKSYIKIKEEYASAPHSITIDISTILGNTSLIIPDKWTVQDDTMIILGGIDDSRLIPDSFDLKQAKNTVIIKGTIIAGTLTIF